MIEAFDKNSAYGLYNQKYYLLDQIVECFQRPTTVSLPDTDLYEHFHIYVKHAYRKTYTGEKKWKQ